MKQRKARNKRVDPFKKLEDISKSLQELIDAAKLDVQPNTSVDYDPKRRS